MPMNPPASANPATSGAPRAPPTSRTGRTRSGSRERSRPVPTPSDMTTNPMNMRMRSSGDRSRATRCPTPDRSPGTAPRPGRAWRAGARRTPRPSARRRRTTPTAPRAREHHRGDAQRVPSERRQDLHRRRPLRPAGRGPLGRWPLRRSSLADRTLGCARRRTPRRGSLRRHGALSLMGSRAASSSGKRLGSSGTSRTAAHTSITTGRITGLRCVTSLK